MEYTVEVTHHNPMIDEEEKRRRLAACYSLLLSLAEKHNNATQDSSGPETGIEDVPDEGLWQES
jgi:hypothetical protein